MLHIVIICGTAYVNVKLIDMLQSCSRAAAAASSVRGSVKRHECPQPLGHCESKIVLVSIASRPSSGETALECILDWGTLAGVA